MDTSGYSKKEAYEQHNERWWRTHRQQRINTPLGYLPCLERLDREPRYSTNQQLRRVALISWLLALGVFWWLVTS